MTAQPTYYKFLAEGAIGPFSGFKWPKPHSKNRPGKWVHTSGPLVMCLNGIHACRQEDMREWINHELYEIQLDGEVITSDDKVCAASGRLIRRITTWKPTTARLFAADCAEKVLPIFEKACPDDDRPRLAIKAARQYARGAIGDAARAAAGAAAWAAAGAAAGAAAWAAAGAAAGAAAWAAAGAAVGDAAGAAARDAARQWQTNRLMDYLEGRAT